MTDTQIVVFLVMPFLFVLTGSMVFFGHEGQKPKDSMDPSRSATKSNTHARKSRRSSMSAK
jgi:hypothetical protein